MKKRLCLTLIFFTFLLTGFTNKNIYENEVNEKKYINTMKQDILCLMMAYPEHIKNIEVADDKVYLIMSSGKKILYDDKKQKTLQEKEINGDIQDMMEQIYPLESIDQLMSEDYNPGRIRVYPLLKEIYGESQKNIENNLTNVSIGYKNCLFNKNNNASKALENVSKEISLLPQKSISIVFPTNGTFNYRFISGTNRLSPHAFGIAIDLKSDSRDYWKWTSRKEGEKRLQSYPKDVVKVFEDNNFIWGGKWGRFDILHFEYRPELILKARYFNNVNNSISDSWHKGSPYNDENVQKYIKLIDNTIEK